MVIGSNHFIRPFYSPALLYAYAPPRHFLYTQASCFVKLFHGKSGESWRVETAGIYMLRFYKVLKFGISKCYTNNK